MLCLLQVALKPDCHEMIHIDRENVIITPVKYFIAIVTPILNSYGLKLHTANVL